MASASSPKPSRVKVRERSGALFEAATVEVV